MTNERDLALIEDVEFLLDCGTFLPEVPQRLGTTPAALQRKLYRLGRPDLGRRVIEQPPAEDRPIDWPPLITNIRV